MERKELNAFIEIAECDLQIIRSGLLLFARGKREIGELELARRKIGSLRGRSRTFGIDHVETLCNDMDAVVDAAQNSGSGISDQVVCDLLDLLANIEEHLTRLRLGSDDTAIDVSEFVEESFERLGIQPNLPEKEEPVIGLASDDYFEVDDEILDIYRIEAEDLLHNIESSLATLSQQPTDKDALWEIRRHAHTFKGAAGAVGHRRSSELAHRVEDLLERIGEQTLDTESVVFDLLKDTTTCLSALTKEEDSDALRESVASVNERLDRLIAQPATPASTADTPRDMPENSRPQTGASAARPNARSIVRVSLDRLDELAKIAGSLISNRSVFERRLEEFAENLSGLRENSRKMQSLAGRYEFDQEPDDREQRPLHPDQKFHKYQDLSRKLSESAVEAVGRIGSMGSLKAEFDSVFESQRRLIEEFREKLRNIRLIQFGTLSPRLTRAVRVACEEEGKKAELVFENENVELDTQMLDQLVEPLLHLLKNSVVHGIESPETRRLIGKDELGTIGVHLFPEDTHIAVTISDDGRGIDTAVLTQKAVKDGIVDPETAARFTEEEAIDLIFATGLTTADKPNINAGRGVGMSIVKESVQSLGGTVSVASEPQRGSAFTIRLPIPVPVANVLLIKHGERTYGIPLRNIKHVAEVGSGAIEKARKSASLQLGSDKYDFDDLDKMLGVAPAARQIFEFSQTLLIESGGRTVAVSVDQILKTEEVVIKPLGSLLGPNTILLGAAVAGSSDVVPILDIAKMLSRSSARETTKTPPAENGAFAERAPAMHSAMVVDDSPSVRRSTAKLIENIGWHVSTAGNGVEALRTLAGLADPPNVILTDVEMPEMDGFEFIESLRTDERLRLIPVVLITSRSGDVHRQRAVELGVANYLVKPFDPAGLIELIKDIGVS